MSLSQTQLEYLAAICKVPVEVLAQAVAKLRSLELTPAEPARLRAAVAEALKGHENAVGPLVQMSFTIDDWIRNKRLSINDALESLRKALTGWNEDQKSKWKQVEPGLAEIVSLKVVQLVARSFDLAYEYEKLFMGGRILTDIRPIFSEDAKVMEGAVIAHVLRLRYEGVDGRHEMTLSIDERDLKELIFQCERALKKSRTALAIVTSAKVPGTVFGSEDNE